MDWILGLLTDGWFWAGFLSGHLVARAASARWLRRRRGPGVEEMRGKACMKCHEALPWDSVRAICGPCREDLAVAQPARQGQTKIIDGKIYTYDRGHWGRTQASSSNRSALATPPAEETQRG